MSKQERIAALESVQTSLAKMVYEMRTEAQDPPEPMKDGPLLMLVEVVKKCQRLQTRYALGSTETRAQADSVINDLLYVSAIVELLAKRVDEANGYDVKELNARLKAAEQKNASLELTLYDIRKLMINCGTAQGPVPAVAPSDALPTYQDAFAVSSDQL